MIPRRLPEPVDETDFVNPATASALSGVTPFALRVRMLEGRSVHTARVRGRVLVRLGDVFGPAAPKARWR